MQDIPLSEVTFASTNRKHHPSVSAIQRLLSTHADRHVVDISFTVCLFVCVCVCVCVYVSAGFLVTDISGVGWRRAMNFCRMVDLGAH